MQDKTQTDSQPDIDTGMYNASPTKVGARKNRQKRQMQPEDNQIRSLEVPRVGQGSNERN